MRTAALIPSTVSLRFSTPERRARIRSPVGKHSKATFAESPTLVSSWEADKYLAETALAPVSASSLTATQNDP